MSTEPGNPFPVNTYQGAEYFCDRKDELQFLKNAILNGESVTLMAIRRIGKTGLIRHFFENKPDGIEAIYVDILDTENMSEFLNKLTSATLSQFKEKTTIGKSLWKFIKSLRPTITFDPLTGAPQASFAMGSAEVELNIEAVFQFLEKQKTTFVIAIDEFQQILNYPEQNVDAWLRTRIQALKNVRFIFSGSQQHLMTDLFANPDRPFYRSTAFLRLQKISQDEYASFICDRFLEWNREITKDVSFEILNWTETHTYYVQQLCNRLYSSGVKIITKNEWQQQASLLIKEQEILFFSFRNLLSKNQWALLKSIAKEGLVYKPTASGFIKKHKLNSSATILKALNKLLDLGLVYSDIDSKGDTFYSLYDVFFKRWSEQKI